MSGLKNIHVGGRTIEAEGAEHCEYRHPRRSARLTASRGGGGGRRGGRRGQRRRGQDGWCRIFMCTHIMGVLTRNLKKKNASSTALDQRRINKRQTKQAVDVVADASVAFATPTYQSSWSTTSMVLEYTPICANQK